MPSLGSGRSHRAAPPKDNLLRQVAAEIRRLVNPVDHFSGATLDGAVLVHNVVMFKRTSTRMLRPRGVTHNHHHRFELVIPLQTAGRIHVDGLGYSLSPGQVFLIFPHQFHHYLEIGAEEMSWLFITFEMRGSGPMQALKDSPRLLGSRDSGLLRQMVRKYLRQSPGAERNLHLILDTSALLRRLLVAGKADSAVRQDHQAADPRGEILESINSYVRANLHQPLTLADLAGHTGYSISHLRAVFRKEFGISLGGYMRDSRLSIAASMLADPGRGSIESIAKACGFVSIFAFSRAFKKGRGLSPSAYSKSVKEGWAIRRQHRANS
jgi:AraC-like DNA-binding protein/quercetin dioxygenase-like cupin family protein